MSTLHRIARVIAAAIVASVMLTACGSSSRANVTPATGGATTGNAVFILDEGVEHDACGIGVVVTFIASTARSSTADYPVLIGGPIGNVVDSVRNRTGDQPLPANAEHLTQGTVATVDGKRFGVNTIDTGGSSVQLTALC